MARVFSVCEVLCVLVALWAWWGERNYTYAGMLFALLAYTHAQNRTCGKCNASDTVTKP